MSAQTQEVREVVATMTLTDNNGQARVNISSKISRELNLADKLEATEPEEDVLVRQRTDPENPDRIVLEVV